jgi:hypothetical protein
MPNWKKVITSGSDASLNTLTVVNGITGSLFGTASYALTASNISPVISNDADTRLVTANGNGTLSGEGNLQFDGNTLKVLYQSGDEGGEILMAKPVTNTTIAGTGVTVDIYQNTLRFFEQGGSARGYYLDITAGGGGASTNLASGGGTVTSVSASGTVSGITLGGGPITGAGTLTLSGTISGLTNSNLSGTAGITNANLANPSLMVGSTNIALGATGSSLAGLTSISATSFTGSLLGTASYATQALTASYALNGGVTQLLAGPNVTLSPTNGLGQVTVSATLSGSTIFNTATGSYGSFYDTTIQTNPIANVPRSMSFNSTDITNGVSISGSTNPFNTYIKTTNAGVYDIQFSAQVDKTDSGADEIVIWLRKNEIDLTDTATTLTLSGNNDKQVAAWNWFVTSAANDYYQIIWFSADTNIRLLAETISATHPGIPSVIVTVNRVDQFLSNTGSFSGSFTGQFTGSLFGTASYADQALTASYASTYAPVFPFTGSAIITGSLEVIGSITSTEGFTGSLQGTSSWASDSISASYASTASYINGSIIKSNSVPPGMFGGTPLTTSITFTADFPNPSYSVTITGEDARIFTIQNKSATGFEINTNSNIALTGNTYWHAISYGEFNS